MTKYISLQPQNMNKLKVKWINYINRLTRR